MNHPLFKLIIQRLALGVVLLFAASLLIFLGTDALPGDIAEAILGRSATEQSLANLRAELNLDQPSLTRYFDWLGGVLQGDLGTSLSNGRDIASTLKGKVGNTVFLAACTAVIAVPIAILLGLIAVLYHNRWPDKMISGLTLSFISIPEFALGYILIFFFAVKLRWLSPTVNFTPGMGFFDKIDAAALPILTLTFAILAHMMRMTRAAILNVMQSAYVETAELKGLSGFTIIVRHAMPNALSPIINVVILNMAYLVVGVVAVEVVFNYDGMGRYLVDHVTKRDMPVVQACGLIFAAVYIGLNMLADILSILTNPRLRHPK